MQMEGVPENSPATLHEQAEAIRERPSTPTVPKSELDRRISGRAVASSIIGLPALYLSTVPVVHLLALILGIIGLKMGIRGFKECNRTPELKGITPAIIGAILCSITILIALWVTISLAVITLENQ